MLALSVRAHAHWPNIVQRDCIVVVVIVIVGGVVVVVDEFLSFLLRIYGYTNIWTDTQRCL